ncbi:MAG: Soluble lytic murein transglycosylase precursor [Actinobacteria bacterium ADurb.Bin346]|nr:MAG: Soluble lytic murein transglycosylase precursor [Actinobacteria bacterium ADurb.Bin346]
MNIKNFSYIIIALSLAVMIAVCGCSQFSESLLKRIEKNDNAGTVPDNESSSSAGESIVSEAEIQTGNSNSSATDVPATASSSGANSNSPAESVTEDSSQKNDTASIESSKKTGETDPSLQRQYFKNGVEAFEKKNYIIAEYYLNKVRDTYAVLADHTLYYYAKSLLLQKKYESAEENYFKLKTEYPDSIFKEKAALEYADLYYITEKYYSAEKNYSEFITAFPASALLPYAKYQLALCQEKNGKYQEAFSNYKSVWLNNPENEYAKNAFDAIESLVEKGLITAFKAANEEIYKRGEIFFNLYWYKNAIAEFNIILDRAVSGNVSQSIYSKTLFKMGMSYFNLRDYAKSKEYLSQSYNKFPAGVFADDSLYFLGRVATNLDNDIEAQKQYESLLSKFPQSNYADDALYRIGRIYFLKDDFETAKKYYSRIVSEYPSDDRAPDAFWELGMIEYKGRDYSAAHETFKGMASKFKGTKLGEKGLFWQAKSAEKLEDFSTAVSLYREIIALKNYSYYTFASQQALENRGLTEKIDRINTKANPSNPYINELLPDVYESLQSNTNPGDITEKTVFSHVDKAKELLSIEFYSSADIEIEAASSQFENNMTGILQISTLYLQAKDYINSQKIIAKYYSKLLSGLKEPYLDYFYYLLYPYGFRDYIDKYSTEFDIDPLYVLAVIREESRFDPGAGSYAGAQGLMQIMPATGKSIANSLDIGNYDNSMLLDPETSIKMGSYYLSMQLGSFGGNKYYAAGAYNGGPGAMNKWIAKWGDKDIDEFIEYVSYDETRNYIRKVMGSYYVYQMLYR